MIPRRVAADSLRREKSFVSNRFDFFRESVRGKGGSVDLV